MIAEVAAAPLVRPWWRRARLWLGLAAFVALAAVLVGTLANGPGRSLDPASAHKDGSKALARLLDRFGVTLESTSSLSTALAHGDHHAVVVIAPDEYSDDQLRALAAASSRLVLAAPNTRAVGAVSSGIEPRREAVFTDRADCADAGALAAGRVEFPDDTRTYLPGDSGATVCFAGALITSPRLAVLGSAGLLRNDQLAHDGVAALDINAITDSRRLTSVVWLLPGSDTAGAGPASIWDVFPPGAHRVFWWLLVVGALLAIWRARRLGAVVSEPLPVVVRAAELVEGHGRLYARAGARDRAASTLRTAAARRLGHRLGLPRGATAEQLAVAAAPLVGRSPADVVAVLAGPPPADDSGLLRLAQDLDRLESALGGSTGGTT